MTDPKDGLHSYLRGGREALLWKLEGLSEHDVRRPLVPTGSNLLGLVKHVAWTAAGYFGFVFDRPFPEEPPSRAEANSDMWATADESRDDILGLWERAWAHADATIEALPLDAVGHVFWWPPERRQVTLQHVLTHMTAEVQRHAGHADILRELVDGEAGLLPAVSNLPDADAAWWAAYREKLEQVAREASR